MGDIFEDVTKLFDERKITSKQYKYALHNVSEMRDALQRSDNDVQKACVRAYTIKSYTFADAMKQFSAVDPNIFYDTVWSSVRAIGGKKKFEIKVADLFMACSSTEFLDSGIEVSAKDFLDGKVSDSDLQELQEVCKTNSYEIREVCGKLKASIYDEIMTASELKESLLSAAVTKDAESVLADIYKILQKSVFQGICNCNLKSEIRDEKRLLGIQEYLESQGFIMTFDLQEDDCTLFVKAKCANGNYKDKYSEGALEEFLQNGSGEAYYFVATYCDKVLIPELMCKCVKDVTKALSTVSLTTEYVRISRRSTKTDVYTQLFEVLRRKGFKITVHEKYYEMRWV